MKTDKPLLVGNLYGSNIGTGMAGNIWNPDGISPTIMTCRGGAKRAYDNAV